MSAVGFGVGVFRGPSERASNARGAHVQGVCRLQAGIGSCSRALLQIFHAAELCHASRRHMRS